jgi:ABC-2 type transport system ATP-binding protein
VLFGRHIFLFEGGDLSLLKEIGELHRPSVADLFVALMGEEYENRSSTEEAA